MRHLLQTWGALLLSVLLTITPSLAYAAASAGWHPKNIGCEGTAEPGIGNLTPGDNASWCPSTTATASIVVKVVDVADCNWNGDTGGTGAGTATLSVKQCTGTGTANPTYDCKTPLFSGVAVTSNTENAHFSLPSGLYLITSEVGGVATAEANGRLVCTGRN